MMWTVDVLRETHGETLKQAAQKCQRCVWRNQTCEKLACLFPHCIKGTVVLPTVKNKIV